MGYYSNDSKNTLILTYYPREREYMLNHVGNMGTDIRFCPYCGKKMPKELSDEWYDILEKEYGIKDPIHCDKKQVPQEFWTDEWWKKRGL